MIAYLCAAVLSQAKVEVPAFELRASDGLTYTQQSLLKKPTLVVFFNESCPHSKMAAPDFVKLKSMLGTQTALVGFTNLPADKVRAYAKELKLNFPLIAEGESGIIRRFGATHSLDLAVIDPQRKEVVKRWNGYSRSILEEAADLLNRKLDLSTFPNSRASGCGF